MDAGDEKARAEEIVRSFFRRTIIEQIGRGLRVGVEDLFWHIRYADRIPAQAVSRYDETRLIRKYYDERWFKDLARQELETAKRDIDLGKGRELLDIS